MTSDHPLRRLLARVCSADTMARVVNPTLADMRWEAGRPAWLGYLALLKALTVHAVMSTPGAVGRVYSDDGHAIPKVAVFSIAGAIVAAVPLGVLPFLETIRRAHVPPFTLGVLLLPQALVLTLPAAWLFAIPLALKRQQPRARLVRRIVVLSIGCAAITFALIAWIMPEANQAYRVQAYRALASGQQELGRGPNETGFAALTRQIESLRTFHGAESAVRRLKYVYQVRLALAGAPVPLGLLALGVARWSAGRRRPLLLGCASLAFYVAVVFPFQAFLAASVLPGTSIAPSVLAWLPNLFVGLLAGSLLARFPSSYSRLPSITESQ
jgi:lipopolysaccharide export LptBFGC system permease protein LptF